MAPLVISDEGEDGGGGGGSEEEEEEPPLPPTDELRTMANAHFANGDYDTALPLYSLAIDGARTEAQAEAAAAEDDDGDDHGGESADETFEEPALVIHLCNRSACLFRMERYDEAEMDAAEAVEASGGRNAKASFRLARTQIQLGKYADAVDTAETALRHLDLVDGDGDGGGGGEKDDDEAADKRRKNRELQRSELNRLLLHARKKKAQAEKDGSANKSKRPPPEIKCIRTEPRQPSIREFDLGAELGVGNFSQVVVCTHKKTKEVFALKIIEKKKLAQLAKRQHPNCYNEVNMERRVLTERLPPDEKGHIIRLYHSFQDYNNLYFLQELHVTNGDLWSTIRAQNKMVGTYPSLVRTYVAELIDAIEHMHRHGVVHRDLKPENVLLNDSGHVVVVDFGTAKDTVWTDLNGPEFVGTPDFMAPEMVKGTGDEEVARAKREGRKPRGAGVDHTADLWEIGAILFQLLVGTTPFAAPSPYLTFLRIQRGNLLRPWGIADDDAWDLVSRLLRVKPTERLGADSFDFTDAEEEVAKEEEEGGGDGVEEEKEKEKKERAPGEAKCYGVGYDIIRDHPYFRGSSSRTEPPARPIPSLRDLALRSTAELVRMDSLDFDVDSDHPPGDGSSHDVLRLNPTDRKSLMHFLDRTNVLAEPRVYRRLFRTRQEARLGRARPDTRDYVGLTRINDKQGNFPVKDAENEQTDFTNAGPICFVHLSSPLFVRELNLSCTEEQRKEWTALLKDRLRTVNRTRPKLVVAGGYLDEPCRKLLAKVNESIPVALNDGSTFYSLWICGAQCLMLQSCDFVQEGDEEPKKWEEGSSGHDQIEWLKEELEQSRLAQHHVFAFVDCDPKKVPASMMKRLARGKVLSIFGPTEGDAFETECTYRGPAYQKDKSDDLDSEEGQMEDATKEDLKHDDNGNDRTEDDACSVGSEESEDNNTSHTTKVVGCGDDRLRRITLEESAVWIADDI